MMLDILLSTSLPAPHTDPLRLYLIHVFRFLFGPVELLGVAGRELVVSVHQPIRITANWVKVLKRRRPATKPSHIRCLLKVLCNSRATSLVP